MYGCLTRKAQTFATAAHAAVKQLRKYTDEPYILHPATVVGSVAGVPHTEEMLAAAWLHDVVEATQVSLDVIREEFGNEVATLVGWLTDVSKPEDGNRATRKRIDREHIAQAPPQAKTIKLADLLDEALAIVIYDPPLARAYMREKQELLKVLQEGDPSLLAMATETVDTYFKVKKAVR